MTTEMKKFSIKDQELWKKCLDNNEHSAYGTEINRFSAAWAHIMEEKMLDGQKLEDIAKESEQEADTEGITGFMYGAGVWEHGEGLRRWHNVRIQIHDEGEKANENNKVLNPAVLNVGVKGDNHDN